MGVHNGELMNDSQVVASDVNIIGLENEFAWLSARASNLLAENIPDEVTLPSLVPDSAYAKLINAYGLTNADRVFLTVAFAATVKPEVFFPFVLASNEPDKRIRFGGVFRKDSPKFYPTVQTVIFLLAGGDSELASYYHCHFNSKHKLFESSLLFAHSEDIHAIFADCEIRFNDQFVATILSGTAPRLDGGSGFPAKQSTRTHTLEEVVLSEQTRGDLKKLQRFARNMRALWSLPDKRRYRNNFISIFSGDPGTGKSHTAEAIGNELGMPVYKVNFAQLVSKYIGETEKNLERVFNRFSGHPSILFFDEAESIFSKRTEVKDSHDKHSNNEQSFLLQKIEEYDGIVILATNVQNLAQYFDKAFQRRIRQIINFSFPDYEQRLLLWKTALGNSFRYEEGLEDQLARNYQFTGGSVYNLISEGIIEALDRDVTTITFEMLEQSIKDEFKKTGRKYEICTDEMVMQNPVKRFGPGYESRQNF